MSEDGWNEYQRLVLAELERHHQTLEMLRSELRGLHTEIAVIRAQAKMYGIVAGGTAALAGSVITSLIVYYIVN